MVFPVLSVKSQNGTRNICWDIQLHVESSRTLQIDLCLQENEYQDNTEGKEKTI